MKGTLFIMQYKGGFKYEQYMNGIKRLNFLKTRYGNREMHKNSQQELPYEDIECGANEIFFSQDSEFSSL